MKKLFLLSSLCAAALFTACSSNDEPLNPAGGDENTIGHYLSVNVVATPDAGSRANTGDPNKKAQYEDGTSTENAVTTVRFYFFYGSGNPSVVKAGSKVNYYDWKAPVDDNNTGAPNVERQLEAVLLISTAAGDDLPEQMVAVLNPRAELGNDSYSLNALRNKTADYAALANKEDDKDRVFPMVNSVYMASDNSVVKATKVTSDHYMNTEKEAKGNPVVIYVERNVAKVRARLAASLTADENGLIKLKNNDEGKSDLTIGEKKVYLKLNGWNVTEDVNEAYLSKRIDTSWEPDILGTSTPWNYAPYFRSYWADACLGVTNRNYDFNSAKKFNFTDGYTYCNENAERKEYNNVMPKATKVILNGMLCNDKGEALTICEYYGVKFIDDNDQTSLKNSVLTHLQENGDYYYKKTFDADNNETKYTSISASDITFKTVTAGGIITAGQEGAYYVIPCLKSQSDEWVVSAADDASKIIDKVKNEGDVINVDPIGVNDVDAALRGPKEALRHAKIWNTGMTYYYADIQHFAKTGVVRNHVYETTISAIYGLGTPVWDPSEVIFPGKPQDEDTYIAAQINILSWRLVPSNVTLDWK